MYMFYTWLRFQTIPGLKQLHKYLWPIWRDIVEFVNDNLLGMQGPLIDPNSSTDTSFSWASLFTMILIALVISIAWSIKDRERDNYEMGEYWLRVAVRYFIAYFALYYGIIKLFALQFPFPSLSQLSTTFGDFSQQRLAWLFFGTSTSYQVFSGILETAAGLFLIYRRTTLLGVILSIAVFSNITAINIFFDAPVKLMALHFFLLSIYLLLFESRRVIDFFILNRPTVPTTLYNVDFTGSWKYGRIGAKIAFIYLAVIATIVLSVRTYKSYHLKVDTGPIEQGLYDVQYFSLNGDSTLRSNDSLRWKDMALYGVIGSIKTSDPLFIQRYNRGYFSFEVDTVDKQLRLKRSYYDSMEIMHLNYEILDAKIIRLNGVMRGDSLNVILKKSSKVFNLSSDQTHWLQEAFPD